jgi:hypothetical protein
MIIFIIKYINIVYKMPRSSSSNKSPISSFRSSSSIKPVPQMQTPTQVQHKIEQPSFMSNIVQGFAWGTGTSIARNIFESKIPAFEQPRHDQTKHEQSKPEINCNTYDLCKKMNDPFDCYSKMDLREYERCSSKL